MAENKKAEKQKKMKRKDFIEEIEIPAGLEAAVENNFIVVKKDGKELKEKIHKDISAKKDGSKIILEVKKARRSQKREFGTIKSHVKNMIEGFEKGWEYELEICIVHFPMTVAYDKDKKEFIIKNLLGEKSPRKVSSMGDIEVSIKAPKITIKSYDLKAAGQTAANLEKITKIRNRDRNKFQDGIFITKKPGKVFI